MQSTATPSSAAISSETDIRSRSARVPARLRPSPRTTRPEAPPRPVRPAGEFAADDAELVARLLKSDPEAWRTFTSRYSGLIIARIRRVLGRFARVTGEQDVDEIYARFCCDLLARDKKKLRAYDPAKGSRLSTWLGMLASHATYDYLRRVRRDRVCEPMPESDSFQTEEPSPYDQAVQRQRADIFMSVIDELSERDQLFIELYFGEGLDVESVARRMNINEKTVYTKKHKITARLEQLLAKSRAC